MTRRDMGDGMEESGNRAAGVIAEWGEKRKFLGRGVPFSRGREKGAPRRFSLSPGQAITPSRTKKRRMNEVPVPEQTPRPSSASVNPADVDRFNRLGDLWWDATGKMGILHEINPIRVDYVRDLAVRYLHRDRFSAQPLEGLGLADIGCGGGILAESLAELGADVTGVDPAPNNIEVAKRHAKKSGSKSTIATSPPRRSPRAARLSTS